MPSPTSLFVATALVAIPSTAGIYHLATSSSSSKTVEQGELNKEVPAQELEPAKGLSRPELETRQDTKEQSSDKELSESPSLTSVPTQNKGEPNQKRKDVVGAVRHALSGISEHFSYDKINSETGARTSQFEDFVIENDSIRGSLETLLKEFVNKEEHKNTDIKTLAHSVLGLELIGLNEDALWSSLIQIRKDEAGAQTDLDKSGLSNLGYDPVGSDVTKDDIVKFCDNPSENNSHLGMYSGKRKEQEETREYRLFTYYSYCTKGSHYLNNKLKFDPISE